MNSLHQPKDKTCNEEVEESARYRSLLPGIIDELIASAKKTALIAHVDAKRIPRARRVLEIIERAKRLLFPGYFTEAVMDKEFVNHVIGTETTVLYENLSEEIALGIRHDCQRYDLVCTRCRKLGQEHSVLFLGALPEMRKVLATDVQAAYDGDPAAKSLDEVVVSYPGLLAITIHRIAHQLWLQEVPLLPRMMSEHAHSVTGIDIHPGASIGPSFFIDHGTGVVIGETTEIGAGVRVYQGVTLGALSLPKEEVHRLRHAKRHPTIEDDVTIYAGATILGGETVIGRGSVIGGNVWITRPIPPGTKVFLSPPKLIYKNAQAGSEGGGSK